MKRDFDYHYVREGHIAIHQDLLNWARVVRVSRNPYEPCAPIFRLYRTDPHYTDEAPAENPIRPLDGFAMEKRVQALPWKHKTAIRWVYVHWYKKDWQIRQDLGLTKLGLEDLIHDARSILKNRA